jgi:hypothetical protein
MRESAITFDIETEALPFASVANMAPESILADKPDAATIEAYADRLPSNWKPETRALKAQEWAAGYSAEDSQAEWMDDAALDPTRSRIYSFSAHVSGETVVRFADDVGGEAALIDQIVAIIGVGLAGPQVFTWNGNSFDLPFIVHRCFALKRRVPIWKKGRWWDFRFVDLMQEMAPKWDSPAFKKKSLDYFLRSIGRAPKIGSGKDFSTWDRAKQIEYATEDVEGLYAIAERWTNRY